MAITKFSERIYTDAELDYLTRVHPLARLATLGFDGTPHVMPVGMYRIDERTDAVVVSGHDMKATKKWRDVLRTGRAAIVFDDVLPPFEPRGIEIRGSADAIDDGEGTIVLYPERIVTWGLGDLGRKRVARDVGPSRAAG